ncbi:hypothetical protein HY491_04600 [Candidatus Woesearchaeota archaeon]|nr:hypothetical protein [Candidatus Woesearchaeota archaeon]
MDTARIILIIFVMAMGVGLLFFSILVQRNRGMTAFGVLFTVSGAVLLFGIVKPTPQEGQESPAVQEPFLVSYITLEGCVHQIPPSIMQEDEILQVIYNRLKPVEEDSSQSVEKRRFHTYIRAFYGGSLCLGERGSPATLR